jgi:hypothetical protein
VKKTVDVEKGFVINAQSGTETLSLKERHHSFTLPYIFGRDTLED